MHESSMALRLVVGLLLGFAITQSHGASFDCAKAQTKAEKYVCGNAAISKLDEELAKAYQDVLGKADGEQKTRVIAEQKHWLSHTRNLCATETCFKHAYWSRLAELLTFFEPKSPLYKKESDKVGSIQQVLRTAPLYESTLTDPQLCRQLLADLKEMRHVRLVEPVAQTQSYEDPAFDPWRQKCRPGRPLNFSYWCEPNLYTEDVGAAIAGQCSVGYGLPPFRLFELPPLEPSVKTEYVSYTDDGYGPMNQESREPGRSRVFSGFRRIDFPGCKPNATSAPGSEGFRNGPNYNSIIAYGTKYYTLMLYREQNDYWLDIDSVSPRGGACRWTPVKRETSK